MALLHDEDLEYSFEDEEGLENKKFRTSFAENMMINNAPEELK